MKKLLTAILSIGIGTFVVNAMAADKVVVIPMGSSATAAGGNMQVQYNDNGTQAGAGVYYDKATGYVGIGTGDPSANLDIESDEASGLHIGSGSRAFINSQSLGNNSIIMETASDQEAQFPKILGVKSRGTVDAFEPVLANDRLFGVMAKGQGSSSADFDFGTTATAAIIFNAAENWSSTSRGSYMKFFTTTNGQDVTAERMRIDNNGNVGIGTQTPQSTLQVAGYMQLATTTDDPPPTGDCSTSSHAGRMIYNASGNKLFICDGSAWQTK